LNGALALISAGKIEVDIGPFAAFFGEKSFEKQVHSDRVNGSNAQRVTHGAIGGRTAALHEDIVFAAEADDVPNDEEVAGKIEFFDQGQFAFDLLAGASVAGVVARAITGNHSLMGALTQELHFRLALGHRIFGELVAQILQGKLQARRKNLRIGDGFRKIGKKALHFGRRFQMAFGIAREEASGGIQIAMMADAGEYVQHFTLVGKRMAHRIGGHERQRQFARDLPRRLIARFFLAAEMPLQFDIDVLATEEIAKLPDRLRRLRYSALHKRMRQRPFFAAGKANQAGRAAGEVFRSDLALAFFRMQFHVRNQAAKILISGAALYEQWVAPAGR